ncbi:MAG: hypothetical protein ACYTHM_00800 [Planctomycetota bacterium]
MKNSADPPEAEEPHGEVTGESTESPPPESKGAAEVGAPSSDDPETAPGVLQVIHDLERRLDSTFSIREGLEADLDAAGGKISLLQNRNAELLKRIAFLEARDNLAAQLQSELDSLHEEKAGSERTTDQLRSQVSDLQEAKQNLEKDVTQAQSALDGMKIKAGDLQTEVLRLQDMTSVEEITDILAETKAKLARASERVRDLESELEADGIAKEGLQRDLQDHRREVQDLRQEVEALKTDQEHLEGRLVRALTQISDELRVFL